MSRSPSPRPRRSERLLQRRAAAQNAHSFNVAEFVHGVREDAVTVRASGSPTPEALQQEIRSILNRGPQPEDDEWAWLDAEASRLAEEVTSNLGSLQPLELDVVCSGGGWRNVYCGGAYSVLSALETRGVVRLKRAAGASSGALAAGCFCCRCPPRDWYRLHDAWWVLHARYGLQTYNAVIRGFIRAFYPADAASRCCKPGGEAYFSVADCTGFLWRRWWPRRLLASGFRDFADFEGAIIASSALPFVIGQPLALPWRGRPCMDGGLVDNCPLFEDGARPQLVVDLGALDSSASEMNLLPNRTRLFSLWRQGQQDCFAVIMRYCCSRSEQPMPPAPGPSMQLLCEEVAALDNYDTTSRQGVGLLQAPLILAILFCARWPRATPFLAACIVSILAAAVYKVIS